MGTKIHANTFLWEYNSVIDFNGSTNNGIRPLCTENHRVKEGQNPDSFMSQMCKNGHLGYSVEKVRQTILEQESIFRNQLRELHRLYGRQQELMNEIKRRDIKKDIVKQDESRTTSCTSFFEYKGVPIFPPTNDTRSLRMSEPWLSKSSTFPNGTYNLGLPADTQERFSKFPSFESISCDRDAKRNADSSIFDMFFKRANHPGQFSMMNPRREVSANSGSNGNLVTKDFFQNSIVGMNGESSQRKRKLFGVEIYEGNGDPLDSASDKTSTLDLNIGHHQENHRVDSFELSSIIASSCMQNLELSGKKPADVLEKDLPWFLRNSQVGGDRSEGKKSSYFMNLDSLQNCSERFFKKAEISERKDQPYEINDVNVAKKILGFPIKVDMDEDVRKNQLETNYVMDLRHHFDLNLSLDEDAQMAPSLPTAIVKIATTEIDLEVPAVIESKTDAYPKQVEKMDVSPGPCEVSHEECDKFAAEAILAISLSEKDNLVDDDTCLKWFAEIISSQCDEEKMIPNGMDDFEFMTLKLEETKEEERYYYLPVLLNNPSDDEMRNGTLSTRSRRGQLRRGRQRKDFQRDILPGLVTLSRLEVTEDLQTFEELGFPQRSSTRYGRGRKRLGGSNTAPMTKTLSSTQSEQLFCQLGGSSLTGWGKRTRRVPRQRCPNVLLSFPIKC